MEGRLPPSAGAPGVAPAPAAAAIVPYAPSRTRAPIDLALDGNEGMRPPDELLAALAGADVEMLRRYPRAAALEARIAARHGLAPAEVLVTAGADDALDRACRAFLCPGREIVLPVPTFEMLARYVRLTGATAREIDWMEGPYPVDAVLAAVGPATAAVAVVSPNNPTGGVATAEDVARIARAAPGALLMVDCAYAEFADEDLTPSGLACDNALVFRTLSKAWGLAGLRVGYVLGRAELVGHLRAVGQPFAVSGPSLALAAARLEGDAGVAAFVARVREERRALFDVLAAVGARPVPSQANFVLARPPDPVWLRDALAGLGIAVRIWPGDRHLGGAARLTCPGDDRALRRLAEGVRAALAPEALLFDLDGVIADVSGSYRDAIVQTARAFGVSITLGDVERAKAAGGSNNDWELTRALCGARGVEASLADVTTRFEGLYQGTAGRAGLRERETLLCPRALLARLARALPLAVVTGRPRADAERFLRAHGVADSFRAVVCLEDAPGKPDPAPVRLALERLGVERAWMVGDTPNDVAAARAAAVVPLGLSTAGDEGTVAALFGAGAARVLARLEELEPLLEALPRPARKG
jgi:histidinol-phosphate aminotransferase